MIFQASTIGTLLWISIWMLAVTYLFLPDGNELQKYSSDGNSGFQYPRRKTITKAILLIFLFFPTLLIAKIFDLWTLVQDDTEQSIKLLTAASNFLVSFSIGGTTIYVAYQQYRVNKALMQIQADRDLRDWIEKVTGFRPSPSQPKIDDPE